MANTSVLAKRFAEIAVQLDAIEATKIRQRSDYMGEGEWINNELLISWRVKARNLISRACGEDSEHYREFKKYEEPHMLTTNYEMMKSLKAVFMAAREDYEGGYLNKLRNLVQAEVFDSELEQAEELHVAGYKLPAAVVAGTVLETTLRQMCVDRNIPTGKLDRMNADLAKSGAYNSIMQKQITALAGIRNSAAHGRPEDFTDDDVGNMISQIRLFLSNQL